MSKYTKKSYKSTAHKIDQFKNGQNAWTDTSLQTSYKWEIYTLLYVTVEVNTNTTWSCHCAAVRMKLRTWITAKVGENVEQ